VLGEGVLEVVSAALDYLGVEGFDFLLQFLLLLPLLEELFGPLLERLHHVVLVLLDFALFLLQLLHLHQLCLVNEDFILLL
jgi:hypothetical protein